MKSTLARTKIWKLRLSDAVNKDELIYRIRLQCDHSEGFEDGYCKACEFNERYLAKSHELFMAGERYDRGIISQKEYWEIAHNDEAWKYTNERLQNSITH